VEKQIKVWSWPGKENIRAEYIYFSGGVNSKDRGCPPWGTTNMHSCLFIGDHAGDIKITYEDGSADTVPLIFGYTLWFNYLWQQDTRDPFDSDQEARSLLENTLFLKGGYEGNSPYLLRIKLRDKPIKQMELVDQPHKIGEPQFSELRPEGVRSGEAQAEQISAQLDISDSGQFFPTHTVNSADPYPLSVKRNIEQIRKTLMTFEEDFASADHISVPDGYEGPALHSSGSVEANITSSVFHHNLIQLKNKIDQEGFFHTSTHLAPSWRYDGFGPWNKHANSYYEMAYSRDCGRGMMSLTDLGCEEEVERSLDRFDEWLMFFPNQYPELQLGGQTIPGHWTVVPNMPLYYSKKLSKMGGWPTRYTYERFGEHYEDFGNPENDGHGLVMLAHWKHWNKTGRGAEWVKRKWTELKEAADYIIWALDNPELSLSSNGLLYSESEGGMEDTTLYCNIPCYLGLKSYAHMAEAIGETDSAVKWRAYADRMEAAVNVFFPTVDPEFGEVWNMKHMGFFHESVTALCADYYGMDAVNALPDGWAGLSYRTYLKNRKSREAFCGPSGLGYDHSFITQTALLHDQMEDAARFIGQMARMCYSPRLPEPYIIPECASVDTVNGVYRRQGDLGNLVHQAEVMKTILLLLGIDDTDPAQLRIMPRLPEQWNVNAAAFPIVNTDGSQPVRRKVDVEVTYPANGKQTVKIKPVEGEIQNIIFRAGPFPVSVTSVTVESNRSEERSLKTVPCSRSGDRSWAWIEAGNVSNAGIEIKVNSYSFTQGGTAHA
jgi:hypothetical protein